MVFDHINNAEFYYGINKDIEVGLKYLENISLQIQPGEYIVNENVKAIVSEYKTIAVFERGYEAHKNVIDIQFPIIGRERIKWSYVDGMDINIPYDKENDRTFFINPNSLTHVDIGNGFFAIMFPSDAHSPKHYINKPEEIKKITIKVKIVNKKKINFRNSIFTF